MKQSVMKKIEKLDDRIEAALEEFREALDRLHPDDDDYEKLSEVIEALEDARYRMLEPVGRFPV